MNPKMHHKRFNSDWINTKGIRRPAIKPIAPGETTTVNVFAMSLEKDQRALDIPRTTSQAFKSNKRSFTQSMILLSANLTSFASTEVKELLATARSTWTLESRVIRVCRVLTTTGRFKKAEVLGLAVLMRNLATNIIPTILIECFRKAPVHTTFPRKVLIWCHRYRIHRIWLRVTANRQHTQLARRWWRSDFNMRIKCRLDRVTAQQSQQSTKVSIMDRRKRSASPDPEALCRLWVRVHQVDHKHNHKERDPSMVTAVMIRCTKSTLSLLKTRRYRVDGTPHHRKIDSSRVIPVHSHQLVR